MDLTTDLTLAANLEIVRRRVDAAAEQAGRNPGDIEILPVTKFVPTGRLRALPNLGYHRLGENRVQELRKKVAALADMPVEWVLIGHLQSNKAGAAAQLATEIQSLNSVSLAESLSRHLSENGRTITALLQVNTSREPNKSGFAPSELAEAFGVIRELPGLRVRGLMTMARQSPDPDVVRSSFRELRELRDHLGPEDLPELSMGMSGDYHLAIEEGATTVRIGTALFGPRLRP